MRKSTVPIVRQFPLVLRLTECVIDPKELFGFMRIPMFHEFICSPNLESRAVAQIDGTDRETCPNDRFPRCRFAQKQDESMFDDSVGGFGVSLCHDEFRQVVAK